MNLDSLTTLAATILALSVASERLVEIIKGFLPPLREGEPSSWSEPHRRAALQLLAVACGIGVTLLAGPALPSGVLGEPRDPMALIALGLLASGGSGLWNALLANLETLKKNLKVLEGTIKALPARTQQGRAPVRRDDSSPT